MRAELCGCARCRTGKIRIRGWREKPVYYFWKVRARGQNRSVNNETYGDVLVKGERRGERTRCVRTATLPAAARARGGPTTPALLVVKEDTPRRFTLPK